METKKKVRANRYETLVMAKDDSQDQAYKKYFGGGAAAWAKRGAFQLELMKQFGLLPHHRFADYGCGPIRGGEHFIRYLEPERYHGYDFKREFISIADEIVSNNSDLREKKPKLFHKEKFLDLEGDYDFILFYSVLNHCGEPERLRTLDVARGLGPRTQIVVTHAHWFKALDAEHKAGIVARTLPEDDVKRLGAEHLGWRRGGNIRLLPTYEIHGEPD